MPNGPFGIVLRSAMDEAGLIATPAVSLAVGVAMAMLYDTEGR